MPLDPNNEDQVDDDDNLEIQPMDHKNTTKIRNKNQILVLGTDCPPPISEFNDLTKLAFRSYLMKNIEKTGFKKPTPVQMQVIPCMMNKREVLVSAPTGQGKTASYCLPILAKLGKPAKEGIRALVIAPTAILVRQIMRDFETFAKGKDWRISNLDKSLKQSKQKLKSKRNDILIATPKKLLDLIRENAVDLSNVEFLILDEADNLLSDGFDEQLDEIITACNHSDIVRGLFSATLPIEVEHLAKTFLRNPITVVVGEKNAGADTIEQKLDFVGSESGKLFALRQLLRSGVAPPILIFVQSIERAQQLYRELQFDDLNIDYIHAQRSPQQTKEVVNNFRLGKLFILICTDVMARGIDFKGVSCVINYDFPQSVYQYIHRIGRCGRAGHKGTSITYFTIEDMPLLRNLGEIMIKSKCEVPEWIMAMRRMNEKSFERHLKGPMSREKIGKQKRMRSFDHKRANKKNKK